MVDCTFKQITTMNSSLYYLQPHHNILGSLVSPQGRAPQFPNTTYLCPFYSFLSQVNLLSTLPSLLEGQETSRPLQGLGLRGHSLTGQDTPCWLLNQSFRSQIFSTTEATRGLQVPCDEFCHTFHLEGEDRTW